jgi:hypothetical protein
MKAPVDKMYPIVLALVLACGLDRASARPPILGVVQGDNVNIRARAEASSEVVTQLSFGDELIIKGLDGDWLEIAPPAGAKLWVHVDYLHENQVKVQSLNVRAGASLNYSVVGVLNRGDRVERLGEKGLWVQVKANEKMSLYISKGFVSIKALPKPKPVVPVPPSPVPPRVAKVVPVPPVRVVPVPPVQVIPVPPVQFIPKVVSPVRAVKPVASASKVVPRPKDLDLVPLAGQGQLARRQGIVHSYLLKGKAPSRFYLSIETLSGEERVCYLKDDSGRLRDLSGQRIFCTGRDYWVQGQKLPVMVVESLRRASGAGH